LHDCAGKPSVTAAAFHCITSGIAVSIFIVAELSMGFQLRTLPTIGALLINVIVANHILMFKLFTCLDESNV